MKIAPLMPFKDYHAVEAWSSSALRAMRLGPPARVLWERANPKADTDDTKRGTAVHCRFITPDLFDAAHVQKPDGMSFSTKEGKAWREANGDRAILPFDEYAKVVSIARALEDKPLVYAALVGAQHREVSLFATDPDTGEAVKARPDWIDAAGYIVDLKCSIHAKRPGSLSYRAHVEGWMHQLAWYRFVANLCGIEAIGGRLVVVCPDAPHYVYCLEVKRNALDLLALENAETLRRLAECRHANEWAGTPDEWLSIEPPIFDNESDVSALVGAEEVSDGS